MREIVSSRTEEKGAGLLTLGGDGRVGVVRCWEADRPSPSRVGASPACLRSLAFVRMGALEEEQNRRLLRARDHIDLHYREPLDIPALASVACMSGAHFIRSFKATFGETPHRYLQRRRVERAMFLLQESDRSITEICAEVGFASLGTFSRTFREIVGQAPSTFREQALARRAAHFVAAPAAAATVPGAVPTCFAMRWTRPSSFTAPTSRNFGEARPTPAP